MEASMVPAEQGAYSPSKAEAKTERPAIQNLSRACCIGRSAEFDPCCSASSFVGLPLLPLVPEMESPTVLAGVDVEGLRMAC